MEWNFVHEKLPENNDLVIVYVEHDMFGKVRYKKRDLTTGHFDGDRWYCTNFLGYRVIAWMRFPEPPKDEPKGNRDGCWNCLLYNGDYCTRYWNNMDESYRIHDRDSRDPLDYCPHWEHDESAIWEQFFGEEGE